MAQLQHLFSPLFIGPLRLANRIVMAPMGTGYADENHCATEQTAAYLAERARGGVGLVITEHTAVAPSGLTSPAMLALYTDQQAEAFARVVTAVHEAGAPIAAQLQHGGRQANPSVIGGPCLAPSPVPSGRDRRIPKELTVEEIREIVRAFAQAARRAQQAGCDGVEIHMAHGYLGASFLSPYLNRRSDQYGGDTRRRCRFAFEVIAAIRELCGDDLAVWARVSGDEFICGGMNIDEVRRVAPLLQEAGYQAIHVSACMGETAQYASAPWLRHQGHLIHLAEAVKREVDVPVIGVGNIWQPAYADALIRDGRVDAVALGRSLLADPHWARKAREGRVDEIIPCLFCNQGCLGRDVPPAGTTQCTVNPLTGREATWKSWPAGPKPDRRKKVVVVGGGPVGMTFALTAAARGHDVHLYDAGDRLGGRLRLAEKVRGLEPFVRYVDWLARQVDKSPVVVHLGQVVPPDRFPTDFADADAVVRATGFAFDADEFHTAYPDRRLGEDGPPLVDADEALAQPGQWRQVVIVGATHIGLFAALALADRGCLATVVDHGCRPEQWLSSATLYFLRREFETIGVKWLEHWDVATVRARRVTIARGNDSQQLEADVLVRAGPLVSSGVDVGRREETRFAVLGDAREVRNLHWGIYEAAEMARRI